MTVRTLLDQADQMKQLMKLVEGTHRVSAIGPMAEHQRFIREVDRSRKVLENAFGPAALGQLAHAQSAVDMLAAQAMSFHKPSSSFVISTSLS